MQERYRRVFDCVRLRQARWSAVLHVEERRDCLVRDLAFVRYLENLSPFLRSWFKYRRRSHIFVDATMVGHGVVFSKWFQYPSPIIHHTERNSKRETKEKYCKDNPAAKISSAYISLPNISTLTAANPAGPEPQFPSSTLGVVAQLARRAEMNNQHSGAVLRLLP